MLVVCSRCRRHVDAGEAIAGQVVVCSCGSRVMVPHGPSEAGKMSCPGCGAPVDPEVGRCSFCSTRLATAICPSCFGTVFQGSKHCPLCGEGLTGRLIVHGDATRHSCPRCKGEALLVEVVEGNPLERCPACEGLWVDRETVERLSQQRDRAGAVQHLTGNTPLPRGTVERTATVGYIKCVVCANLMNRQNFGRYSGVVVDVCRQHGTWFDAGELHRILTFVSVGGLEKAAQREREVLVEQMRRLRLAGSESLGGLDGATLGMAFDLDNRGLASRSAIAVARSLLKKLF